MIGSLKVPIALAVVLSAAGPAAVWTDFPLPVTAAVVQYIAAAVAAGMPL
jgi:hypothetical protein